MNDRYDMKEQMKEIFETKGGKAFFNELNAAGNPFFFVAAVENTGEKTDYICETITPGAMGIRLTDDKFADHLNVQHRGFVTVLKSQTIPPDVKRKAPCGETGTGAGSASPKTQGPAEEGSGRVTALELLEAMVKNVILEHAPVQEPWADDAPAMEQDPGQCGGELSIVWGTKLPDSTKDNGQDRNTRN